MLEKIPVAEAVLVEARSWIGTPYRHQQSRKGIGCDCLGLVRGVWRAVYGRATSEPGPYAPDWAEAAAGDDPLLAAAREHCIERAGLHPERGDLLLFRLRPRMAAKHCGIAIDAGNFIHAYQGHAVMVSHLDPHWRRRLCATFSFPDN